jgi:hypothetical protein
MVVLPILSRLVLPLRVSLEFFRPHGHSPYTFATCPFLVRVPRVLPTSWSFSLYFRDLSYVQSPSGLAVLSTYLFLRDARVPPISYRFPSSATSFFRFTDVGSLIFLSVVRWSALVCSESSSSQCHPYTLMSTALTIQT